MSRQRLSQAGNQPDRFEREQADFFVRVRRVYLKRAAEFPRRIKIIDGSEPIAIIKKTLEEIVTENCFR